MDLLDLAPDAVARARSAGADAAEAFAIAFTTRSVHIEDNAPKVAEDRAETASGCASRRGNALRSRRRRSHRIGTSPRP